jgi:hypothetical protein
MKDIVKTIKRTIFALAIAATAACSSSDDVSEIFTGHNWKLTYIDDGNVRRWPSADKSYSLRFTTNGFTATTPSGGSIKGRWTANGETRTFFSSNINASGIAANDTIGLQLQDILTNATQYNGDTHYLQIIKDNRHLIQFYDK